MGQWIRIINLPQNLFLLIIINALGTLYGYYWYADQLKATPLIFWPVVPDSPTSSLFFTWALIVFLRKKHSPYIESFGALLSVKYGVWAVAIILFFDSQSGVISPADWMLMISHFCMAVESFLFLPRYSFRGRHIAAAGCWLLFNDLIDYTFDVHPWLPSNEYDTTIGWLTASLSGAVILVFLWLQGSESKRATPILE
jgi:uncharacterized membrane protein YpjA